MSERLTTAHPVRHQNDRYLDEVWEMRHGEGLGRVAYVAAARRLGAIDASWSRTATACSSAHPCYECCLRALRALEAAAELGSTEQVSS